MTPLGDYIDGYHAILKRKGDDKTIHLTSHPLDKIACLVV